MSRRLCRFVGGCQEQSQPADRDDSPVKRAIRSAAAVSVIAGMAGGFVYSGIASARSYARLFDKPAAWGDSASIDEQIAALDVSAAQVREAVQRAAWPRDADVSLVVDARQGGAG